MFGVWVGHLSLVVSFCFTVCFLSCDLLPGIYFGIINIFMHIHTHMLLCVCAREHQLYKMQFQAGSRTL